MNHILEGLSYTTMAQKPVSYRQNRNYSQQFEWTYVLNEDLHRSFNKARKDLRIGYINHLKSYWGEFHPELSNFTSKSLRDQASRVEKHKADRETAENSRMPQHYNENIKNNTDNHVTATEQQNEHQQASMVNQVTQGLHDNEALKEKVKNIFDCNYQYYIKRELKDRVIPVKANKKIELNTLKTANEITSTHLQSIENISLREINFTIYSIAISCKEIMDDITTPKQENTNRKQEKPKWIVNLENNIERIRTEIAHIQVIINCKKKGKFTKRQNTILHRLTKKYGNTKMRTLETKLALLKQDLRSKSEKLKHEKRISERKRINNRFFKSPKQVYRSMKGNNIVEKLPEKKAAEKF